MAVNREAEDRPTKREIAREAARNWQANWMLIPREGAEPGDVVNLINVNGVWMTREDARACSSSS
jgi:hypothetical protein